MSNVFIPGEYYGESTPDNPTGITDLHLSRKYLTQKMMDKYNITEKDLHDISIVKGKIREVEINNILK